MLLDFILLDVEDEVYFLKKLFVDDLDTDEEANNVDGVQVVDIGVSVTLIFAVSSSCCC